MLLRSCTPELTDDRGGGARPHGAEGSDIGLHMQTTGAEIGVTYVQHDGGRARSFLLLFLCLFCLSPDMNGVSGEFTTLVSFAFVCDAWFPTAPAASVAAVGWMLSC